MACKPSKNMGTKPAGGKTATTKKGTKRGK